MLFTYNEAIARNEVSVITNSFAHREDSEPRAVRRQYRAGPGWDMVTGWGGPDAEGLLRTLP